MNPETRPSAEPGRSERLSAVYQAHSTDASGPMTPAPRRRGLRFRLIRLASVLTLLTAAALVVFHRPIWMGNWGVVEPGRVYRSAQPGVDLDALVREHGIRSILNLRGGSYADDWYRHELAVADARGLAFYDFPMKATERPSRHELLTLIDLMERGPFPMLVHCKSGADRTGLAAAIARMMRRGEPPETAEAAFSIWHGHVPIAGPERLHEPIDAYRRWLEAEGLDHRPERFRAWVERHYRGRERAEGDRGDRPASDAAFEPLEPGPRWERWLVEEAAGAEAATSG